MQRSYFLNPVRDVANTVLAVTLIHPFRGPRNASKSVGQEQRDFLLTIFSRRAEDIEKELKEIKSNAAHASPTSTTSLSYQYGSDHSPAQPLAIINAPQSFANNTCAVSEYGSRFTDSAFEMQRIGDLELSPVAIADILNWCELTLSLLYQGCVGLQRINILSQLFHIIPSSLPHTIGAFRVFAQLPTLQPAAFLGLDRDCIQKHRQVQPPSPAARTPC